MTAALQPTPRAGTSVRNRRLLLLMIAIAIAPVALSYLTYYFWPRDARVNYGELLAPQVLAPIVGVRLDGAPFATDALRGRWLLLFAAPGACDAVCTGALYASRQARTIQNADRDRVQRVWLVTDGETPPAAVLAAHPDLAIARVPAAAIAQWPRGVNSIYVVDPLGNFVLAWPSKPDIKAMAKDLGRLLRASSIG